KRDNAVKPQCMAATHKFETEIATAETPASRATVNTNNHGSPKVAPAFIFMPNFKDHALVGARVRLAAYCVKHNIHKTFNAETKFELDKAATWVGVGALAASIPDLIEPATSPNHRGFFHSI